MVDKKTFAGTWQEAQDILKRDGLVNIVTSGGSTWNNQVAERLTKEIGQAVVFLGEHPSQKGAFQFSINLKSNQAAKILLAKDY